MEQWDKWAKSQHRFARALRPATASEELSTRPLEVPYVYGDLIEIRQVIHGRIVVDRYRVDAFLEGSPGRVELTLSRIATED